MSSVLYARVDATGIYRTSDGNGDSWWSEHSRACVEVRRVTVHSRQHLADQAGVTREALVISVGGNTVEIEPEAAEVLAVALQVGARRTR